MLVSKNLTVQLGKKQLLDNISFTLGNGEVVLLAGENGAGKTTLIKAVMGIQEGRRGAVSLYGKGLERQYHRIACMSEELYGFPCFTVEEYGRYLAAFYPEFSMEQYRQLTGFFSLDSDKKLGRLSKGQRAKAEFAACFSKNCEYILLDEMFLGNDAFSKKDIIKYMAASLKENQTVLMATHELSDVENFVDRILLLKAGGLAADISMDLVREQGMTLLEYMEEELSYDSERYESFLV